MPRIGVAVVALALALPQTSVADVYVDGPDRSRPDVERCVTEGGIVGRRNCPPYGMWGAALEAPYVIIRIGVNMRHLPRVAVPNKLANRASMTSTETPSTATPGVMLPGASDTSYSIAEQISISMNRFMYLGFEVEISPTTAEQVAPGTRTFAAGAQGVLGLQAGTRSLKLGAELAGGGRVLDTYLADGGDDELVLEARARGDLWLTPWFTVGVAVGTSLLDREEWMAGVHLGVHSYSFGGSQ